MQISRLVFIGGFVTASLGLGACGGMLTGEQLVQSVKQESTATLCYTYGLSETPLTAKLAIEAELVSRGEKTCYGKNFGGTSISLLGKSNFERDTEGSKQSQSNNSGISVGTVAVDCSDFPSSAAAQKYFLASGGPSSDPHNLDGDGDGLACEWGKAARKAFTYRAPTYRAPSYTTGRTCYRGPRGGTYTITASGNKNYGGC